MKTTIKQQILENLNTGWLKTLFTSIIEKDKKNSSVVTITDLSRSSNEYLYMLLSRLQMDCEYYLKAGGRNKKHLWALDEKAHIKEMIGIYNYLKVKPKWLTKKQLKEYKKQILN